MPVDPIDNVLAANEPAGCWVADYDRDGTGVQTFVALNGNAASSQNFRGSGSWIQTRSTPGEPIASGVDQVILRRTFR